MDTAKVRALELQKWLVPPRVAIPRMTVSKRQPGDLRVYEIAKRAKVESREVMAYMDSVGLSVRSPSTLVPPLCAGVILRHFQGGE